MINELAVQIATLEEARVAIDGLGASSDTRAPAAARRLLQDALPASATSPSSKDVSFVRGGTDSLDEDTEVAPRRYCPPYRRHAF